MEEQSNQLNLTVVALVALVAIVGLVALVMHAPEQRVATGSTFGEASPAQPAPELSPVAGEAKRKLIAKQT